MMKMMELQADNERLKLLLDNIRENFFSIDWVNKKLVYISDICTKIYGYPPESFIADPEFWFKVIHPDDKERVAKTNDELKTGKKLLREYRIIHADGSTRWVSNTVVPTLNDKGEVTRLDGYTSDITERKRGLEKIEELSMLICRVSHDLRGPLNSAKNYISIALDNAHDSETAGSLEKINKAYNIMERQVFSLLDLEKIYHPAINIQKVNLLDLTGDVIASISDIKGFKEVQLEKEIDAAIELNTDKQCLHSIIYNLLTNAIRYRRNTADAYVRIAAKKENENIVITVSDNGKGIPEEIRGNLFDKFVKGNNNPTGIGIGLYIVKNMTDKLKGHITFESKESAGTSFTIVIPG